jgi:hypothetical protein
LIGSKVTWQRWRPDLGNFLIETLTTPTVLQLSGMKSWLAIPPDSRRERDSAHTTIQWKVLQGRCDYYFLFLQYCGGGLTTTKQGHNVVCAYYLKNKSFLLDVKILCSTIFKVIKKEGVDH